MTTSGGRRALPPTSAALKRRSPAPQAKDAPLTDTPPDRSTGETSYAAELAAIASLAAALRGASAVAKPWPHWRVRDMFPERLAAALAGFALPPANLGGVSGRRELHNDQRVYVDAAHMARYPAMRSVAEALQSAAVVAAVAARCGAALGNTFLRIEYATDTDGFWLEPHTDIGVKAFTCFVYLDAASADLGTDLYSDAQTFACRVPFVANTALAFVPGDKSWHGFAPRKIAGVRRSLIINYVGAEWRAREQLAFPDRPISLATN